MAKVADFSISWPGCGVMVFWQLGVLKGLSRHVDTSLVPMLGSSSGALVTAMAACGVRPEHAANDMQRLLSCKSIRQRRLGLIGVLGDITRTWLDNCLPSDAGARLSRRSTVLVTRLPLLTTTHITHFASKQDVVDVVLASAHLPLLLDGNWYALCRQQPVIDGGFWWWWQRCEKPYRLAGGAAPQLLQEASTAAAAAADAAAHITLTPHSGTHAPPTSALAAALPGPLARLWPWRTAPPPPPPPVSYCSPTSLLDFIAADVQRFMAPDVGLGAGGGGGGAAAAAAAHHHRSISSSLTEYPKPSRVSQTSAPGGEGGVGPVWAPPSTLGGGFGRPGGLTAAMPRLSSAAATAAAAGHGTDLDRGHVRNLALMAAMEGCLPQPPPPLVIPASMCAPQTAAGIGSAAAGGDAGGGIRDGRGGGGSKGNAAVLLVQPSDDDALAAGWRRYRRWRPDDLSAAWEMMRHGEAYGSGPLLRRLEDLG